MDIPETGGLKAPAGAETLQVKLGSVVVEGGFPEVAADTEAALNKIAPLGLTHSPTVTLTQIYEAASQIEAAHARAGFVLARVVIPPQDLKDGGTLRIVVIDGFIEQVDVSALPKWVRAVVARRLAGLQGRKHLRLSDIEMPLLIANEIPGLTLRSTLVRGDQPGGTRLVIEGRHELVSGSVGADNGLASSLGTWSVNTQVSLNSAFGAGEQLYGFVSTGYDVSKLFSGDVRERVLGGGAVFAFGDGRFTLNPEATFTRTQPSPSPGAPATVGDLHRFALRASYTLAKTRSRSMVVSGSVEQLEESNKAPQFALTLSRDRYMVARLGLGFDRFDVDHGSFGAALQLSQGLGGLGGRDAADVVASGVGYSRVGADNDFTKVTAQGHALLPLAADWDLAASAKAQTSFGAAVFRAEQFSLEGADGVSAYVGGSTAVDQGVAARLELRHRFIAAGGKLGLAVSPYIFSAGGLGSISKPTILEPKKLNVAALGAGIRAGVASVGLYFNVEYAYGFSNVAALDKSDRANVTATLRF
ncbi:MAG: ShlB/FhaC/HecB family hemolysin secretion/activation protein [Sphingomonas bacterium]